MNPISFPRPDRSRWIVICGLLGLTAAASLGAIEPPKASPNPVVSQVVETYPGGSLAGTRMPTALLSDDIPWSH